MKSLDCLSKESIFLLHNNRLLLPLIKSELIKNKLSEISLEKKLEDNLKKQLIKKLRLENKEDLDKWKESNGIDEDRFSTLATTDFKLKKYSKETFGNQVEARFLKRKQDLDIVIYSLIRVKSFFKARELFYRIIGEEENFGDLASTYSEGIEKKTRGIVGPGPLARIHPKLAEHIKNSEAGQVQSPIEIDGFFLIIRVESYDPAKLDDFMREKMEEELFNTWIEQKANQIGEHMIKTNTLNLSQLIEVKA
tara:strand:- start:4333 stop:5085 length:753 start_codon:yes stop_codon:yes gene_type:complete